MGGVNTNRDYAQLMDFGHWDTNTQMVKVDRTLLQGGIVCLSGSLYIQRAYMLRLQYITSLVPWWALCSVAGLAISMVVSMGLAWPPHGLSWVLCCSARLRITIG